MTAEPGLRERKKQQTRQLLADTARRLFAERGFEKVSVAEIARVANVSQPTVFNYFPTKEDLVYSALEQFEDDLLTTIRDRTPEESILQAFGRFILRPRGFLAAEDEQAAARLVEISRMIAESAALQARERQILDRYTSSLAALIAKETRASDDDPRPAVTAAALIGVHRTLIEHVRRHILAGDRDLTRLARTTKTTAKKALAHLEHGLGDYGATHSHAGRLKVADEGS
jgi:AcrR family transcriptional regulator